MPLHVRSLAVFVALSAFVVLLGTGRFNGMAQVDDACGTVHPDVLAALSDETTVPVIISLQLPSAPLDQVSIPELSQYAARTSTSLCWTAASTQTTRT